MIGKSLSHYKILEKLGEGGMGIVYKAKDTKLDRSVALKFLPPYLSQAEEEKKRFICEAQAASRLDHNNICTVHEIEETEDGQMFIAMVFYEGETLKKKIERGPLQIDEVLDISIQIADGLKKAHENNILHRDIKPANIFMTNDGVAKILDFGLAKLSGQTKLTKTGSTLGTVFYMSTEQTQGEKVDHRTDIWSFGVLLYEMITSQLPFQGDYEQAVVYSILNEEPKPLTGLRTGVPMELERIVNKALEKNPAERYQSVGDLIVDLKKLKRETDSTVKPPPVEVIEKAKKKNLLKKTLIPVATGLILILAFLLLRSFIKEDVLGSAPVPIAVLSFENHTGDDAYDRLQKVIPNLLITSLEQSKYLRVTTWQRMYDLLKQVGREDIEVIDEELGFELCRIDGVDAIVLGSITKLGDVFVTDIKVLDVHTKELLKSVRSEGKGVSSIIEKQIDDLAREVSRGVGLSDRRLATVERPVAEMTTTSLEAYHLYLRGREERERFHYSESILFHKKALALDSTFAMAYCDLADAYYNTGADDSGIEAIEKAKRYSEKATEKERLFIEAIYAGTIERDRQKKIRILTRLTRQYLKYKDAYQELGLSYSRIDYSRSIEAYNKVVELDPFDRSAWNALGYVYEWVGNYEKAMECFERYAAVSPGDANPYDSMGELYLTMGRIDEALEKYKKAVELEPGYSEYPVSYIYAMKENYHEAEKWADRRITTAPYLYQQARGHSLKAFYTYWKGQYDSAMTMLDRTKALSAEAGDQDNEAYVEWLRAWIYYERDKPVLARKCFKRWFAMMRTWVTCYNTGVGLVCVKEGKIDSAKINLQNIKEYLPKIGRGWKDWGDFYYGLLYSEILLAENKPEEAIAFCEKHSPLGNGFIGFSTGSIYIIINNQLTIMKDVLARAYYQSGNIDKAIKVYEKLISFDPNRRGRDLIQPRYYYRLAKLYEEKGKKDKAIERYEKFLDIWKGADEDLPELIDATARLARLKGLG
ncbi:protein kinase [candidate division KSB1 bacterium]|nr:protein kinase [candidate division KSB1 bacterium]